MINENQTVTVPDPDREALPWDGSDLGSRDFEEMTEAVEKIEGEEFWKLRSGDYCIVKDYKEILPCFLDEIKPFFGLAKRGTHRVTLGKKMYLLMKYSIVENSLCWEPRLDKIPLDNPIRQDKTFREEVKRIFTLRELSGVSGFLERNITLRLEESGKSGIEKFRPMSCNEKRKKSRQEGKKEKKVFISETLQRRWFREESMGDVTRRMCQHDGDYTGTFSRVRNGLTEIAERIDRDSIVYVDIILDRLYELLLEE